MIPELEQKKISPFIWWATYRIKKNKNLIIVINGPTGSGKTYAALRLAHDMAEGLGTDFTVDGNMAFNFKSLLKKTMKPENKEPGTVFLFEEVGAFSSGAAGREWQSQANKFFFSFLQTTRHRRQVLIFTCPNFSHLEKGCRELCHIQMETMNIDYHKKICYLKPFILQVNMRTGKMYFKYLRFTVDGVTSKLSRLACKIPPAELVIPYEEEKLKFTSNLNKEILETGQEKENKQLKRIYTLDKIANLFKKGLKNVEVARIMGFTERTIVNYKNELKAKGLLPLKGGTRAGGQIIP